ncbi:MAG TPA: helicase C-terminal domain-containing protein [Thermoanaerobaculia bacterium]|jgi:DNA excision repair protein ERCC-2|nr:helicase C-terminal domain-containing protein [Thermoanaerobaculia bacterium]
MAPRFDATRRALDLAVADLLDTSLLRSLGFANRGGYERMWLGQAIHSRYQEETLGVDPTYKREVVVVHRFEHHVGQSVWQVSVSGRIDGLRKEQDGTLVVEEIKSVRRGATLAPHIREMYQRQALLYAWMLASSEEAPEKIRAELVLISIGGHDDGTGSDTEREKLDLDLRALDLGVRRRLNLLIHTWEAGRQAAADRHRAAERLRFPFPEIRPGQEEILAAAETAVANHEHLLLQATTGIGKTVAALYPALRHALANDQRLFVLTAKTTQQEMATAVIRLLDQDGAFRAVRLRAKAKMCANDQIICHEEYCRFAKDYALKLHTSGVIPRLLDDSALLEPDAIFAAAKAAEVCPFEVSLELSGRAQVTICDYNYAFDPYVSLPDFAADRDLSDTILVIDEVHNLVDRGRGYYSPELSSGAARRAAEGMQRVGEPIHFKLQALCARLAHLIENAVADALEEGHAGERAVEAPLPEEALWRLRPAFDEAFVDYLEYQRDTKSFRPDDPFVDLYFQLLKFLNGVAVSDAAFSHTLERRGGDSRLRVLCKDPSRFLGGVLGRCSSVIGLSATLSPPEFYTGLLGFGVGRTAFVEIANPFPAENRRVVIDATVETTWKLRAENYGRIAQRLAAFVENVPGNCLALFPSYQFLAEVAPKMRLQGKRLLIQRQSDSDRERELILEALRTAIFGDIVLAAVAGGAFAEGVDYPGEMLKGVAIIGPCLPGLSLDQELLKAYYEERFDKGFEYAFVVPGLTRVVQAAGRLIRSPADTGVIALFDRRFLATPYRRYLPADWLPEEGAGALVGDPAETAAEFFTQIARQR